MNRIAPHFRRLVGALTIVGCLVGPAARGQSQTPEERLKILTDPESVKQRIREKEKQKPPFEVYKSQVAPFDVLPFIKANHWATLSLEMQSNDDDYVGLLQTSSVRLLGIPRDGLAVLESPQEVVYRREARLLKEQRARLGLQILMPRIPKEMVLELTRPDAIRADEYSNALLRVLEPHQMLVLVLSKDSTEAFARWGHFPLMFPSSADRGDVQAIDRQRYYRLVLPLQLDQLPLSAHPLTWSTLSHVIWDSLSPEKLNTSQQQAMVDWLHWGGQIILLGGAKGSFAALQDSFLAPYLPAEPTGENVLLKADDLKPLADSYRPTALIQSRDDPQPVPDVDDTGRFDRKLYLPPEPIIPASNRPVFLAGLRPAPGASVITLGESSSHVVAVEQRVGRGRVLMLALNPVDPALTAWPGLDTFIRRVLLRRPEETLLSPGGWNGQEMLPPSFNALTGPELSWFRILSRDVGAAEPRVNPEALEPRTKKEADEAAATEDPTPRDTPAVITYPSVAEWVDSSRLPLMSRDALEEASGISIPSSWFVLKVILAYVIALVPLNWLICRYVLGRRELAWLVVPALSLIFAVGVERAAAYDLGYDEACDEIDILESYGGYQRGHLSRFASLYSTGRVRFTISFPNLTALALPQDNGRSLRGEDVMTSTFQSQPTPALEGFQVQPRSLALFRAEEMMDLLGEISLVTTGKGRRIANTSNMELRDAVLIDVNRPDDLKQMYLGTIPAGATIEVKAAATASAVPPARKGELNPAAFLKLFSTFADSRPEDTGEIRLVAWVPKVSGGMQIEPAVDRHRGFTVVVVHLKNGPPPDPDGPTYNFLARDLKSIKPAAVPESLMNPPPGFRPNVNRRRGPRRSMVPPPIAPTPPVRGGAGVR